MISRLHCAGAHPTITTGEVLGPIQRNKEKSKFNSPVRPPTEPEKLEILYLIVKTGISTIMSNHTYRWNGSVKVQGKGGGIGDKLAQAAARLYLIWWDNEFLCLVQSSGLVIRVYKRYVDDGNIKGCAVSPGLCWDENSRNVVNFCPPEEDQRPADQRTAEVVKGIANSVSSMLQWTCDFPSAHTSGKMPVLDIQTWVTESEAGTVTRYEFYRKPVSNPVSIPANSALSNGVKLGTYRQEVMRILRNTSVDIPWKVKAEHLTDLSWRMKLGGYREGFRSQVLAGGITGYLKKMALCTSKDLPFNRPKEEIMKAKRGKNSTLWFQGRNKEEVFASVLFVPYTPGSELAKRIRCVEAANHQGRDSRIKVVELGGRSLVNTLSNNYPWAPVACNDQECFPCSTNASEMFISCRKPGMAYKIVCTICPSSVYEGETSMCLYERGKKHLSEFSSGVQSNCMVIHNKKFHSSSTTLNFRMKGLRHIGRPLDRQIDEAMRIKNSSATVVMNSGAEWRQPAIPRASFSAPGLERRITNKE